ncbi:DUF6090 family protein [Winogradskyella wandonensis]|uniref:DUF6090 family protein n=1 Tax=Winogradskyella wandonensis TaxID=1442586 RepID=UPI0018EEA350|nr:DUF6090 family protein [Winogradskyella wandonensis]
MKSNKIVKYLGYALGEIVLVVIGILIAVAINNSQQEKEDREELNRILEIVKNDLKNDISTIDEVLVDFRFTENLMSKMLQAENQSKDFLSKCSNCRYILSEYSTALINTKGRNLLKSYNKIPEDIRVLVDSINIFYDNYIETIDINNQFMKDEVITFNKYLRDNKPWFKDYFINGKCNQDCADYFSTQEYINRIALANVVLSDALIPLFEEYKSSAEGFVKQL